MDNNKKSKSLSLRARISDHLHWLNRKAYSQLIEDYLNFKIDDDDFGDQFSDMLLTIERESGIEQQDDETLKKFKVSPESYQFGEWVSAIHFYSNDVGYYMSDQDDYLEESLIIFFVGIVENCLKNR